jgi:hypothetical protein
MGKPAQTIAERLLSSFVRKNGCWLYKNIEAATGYGRIHVRKPSNKQLLAHREMYKLLVGEIPKGMQLDHLCRNRACVNPDHLEPVTSRENLLRSNITLATLNKSKIECINGHKFTIRNTYNRKDGTRECKTCRREAVLRYQNKLILEGGY